MNFIPFACGARAFDLFQDVAAMAGNQACGKVFAELAGLADRWEGAKTLRKRVTDIGCLLVEQPQDNEKEAFLEGIVTRSLENARYNQNVLLPLMHMMHGHHDKIPELPALVTELDKFFKDNQRKPSKDLLINQAWSIRYLFGITKQLMNRPVCPRVARLHYTRVLCVFCCCTDKGIDHSGSHFRRIVAGLWRGL